MRRRTSCLLYLLLNVILSAAATLTVLVLWQRAHPLPVIPGGSLPPTVQASSTPLIQDNPVVESTPRPTFPPGQVLATMNVFGTGTLDNELVKITSSSEASLPMAGWKLEDGQGNSYVFPVLDLNPGGAVQVHTGPGDDTPIDLYWGRDTPVWQVGKTVTLRDDQGNVRSTFTIP